MISSINHPWGISEDAVKRYGKLWAELDFTLNDRLTESSFKRDWWSAKVGTLHIGGSEIDMTASVLVSTISELKHDLSLMRTNKNAMSIKVDINPRSFNLNHIELSKLSDTLENALDVIKKKYALGLYL